MSLASKSTRCIVFAAKTFPLVFCTLAPMANAMGVLNDAEMSAVTGQDGLTVALPAGASLTATETEWRMDDGTARSAAAILQSVDLQFLNGTQTDIDVGQTADGQPFLMVQGSWTDLKARVGALSHSFDRDNAPLVAGEPDRTVDKSIGIFGIESTGSIAIGNSGFFAYGDPAVAATAKSIFKLNTLSEIFYRQSTAADAPEISFGNVALNMEFVDAAGAPGTGRFGIYDGAIALQADYMDFDLNFDLFFAPTTTAEFDKVSRQPMILFGWEGGLENTTIRLKAGGYGYGDATDTSIDSGGTLRFANYMGQYDAAVPAADRTTAGLTVQTLWDFRDDFTWILGQASGDRSRVDFFNYKRLGGAGSTATNDFELTILLDAINAGQGPGGICFGGNIPTSGSLTSASCTGASVAGTYKNTLAKDGALAVSLRDGGLHAYSSEALVRDVDGGGAATEDRFDWSLLYTFGKLDANFFFYPTGAYVSPGVYEGGLTADVLLAIQSPGYWKEAQTNFADVVAGNDPRARWADNTHFLIADTDINDVATGLAPTAAALDARESFGIGILNADLLWQVDDLVISLASAGDTPGTPIDGAPGLKLETTSLAKYQFRGLFGGGALTDLSDPVRIALLDVNIETDRFTFIIGPPRTAGDQYVAFDAILNFNSNAYISLAEPSSPSASIGAFNIAGQIAWKDGRIELQGSQQTASGRPELTVANQLLIGSTAGGADFTADVKFGADRLFSIAIPSAQISSSISLTPQN